MKRILCLIDALGPGGAERQMVGLASMLKSKGYGIKLVYFEPKHFFKRQLQDQGIVVNYVKYFDSKFRLLIDIREEIKEFSPDIVISYLQSSSIIACILKLSGLKYKLIVSERNTNINKSVRDVFRFNLFRLADYVVPNSYSQQIFINNHFSFLRYKTKVIVNYVDIDTFFPVKKCRGNLIIVVATVWPSKNVIHFINSIRILKDSGFNFYVKWFGKVSDQSAYLRNCEFLIDELNLRDNIELLDKTQTIAEEYRKADYFCLPSLYEGTPNVICEAMASGLPVVCSDVCDNWRYVDAGVNGFLFDPNDPNDIALTLKRILSLSDIDYQSFCRESRRKSVACFSNDKFINAYLDLIEHLI